MRALVEFGMRYKSMMILLTVILVIGGIYSYFSLGRLEDPPFSVKSALVLTQYPGATPEEVEQEVTDRLETAIHQMPQVKHIYSMSREGLSYIKVDINDRFWAKDLPQVWDELRRKVDDAASALPPGADKPRVVDDFGFVFGFLLALTGDGYSYAELEDAAEMIQKQLYLVPNIARIDLWGVQQRVIHLDISNQKLSELRLSPQTVNSLLIKQNMVVDTGSVDQKGVRYPIHISGEFKTPQEIENLLIQPKTNDVFQEALASQKSKKSSETFAQEVEKSDKTQFMLGDIAKVSVGYQDPPVKIMKFNGAPSVGIQIAGMETSNIVEVGKQIDAKLKQIQADLPVGIELHKISWQSAVVEESVSGFVISMIESIAIVLIVLLIPSGFRMGGIIGIGLVLTILATFLYMFFMKIPLERMSLGALIIAMGMMVDNSIVVADGIAVNLRKGMEPFQAAVSATATPAMPLLFATIIAVMSFYPIYASEGSTGEYCRTLFVIVGVSLMISWFIAMLMTPQHCLWFLGETGQGGESGDEYNTPFFNRLRQLIHTVLNYRYLSLGVLVGMLVISLFCFQFVVKLFFPFSTRPQLMVDYWAPAGTTIHDVAFKTDIMENKFKQATNVESVSSFIGAGPPRFYLPVDPEFSYANYGQLLVNFKGYHDIDPFIAQHEAWLQKEFPEALVRIRKYNVGPGDPWKFELRVLGPSDANPAELRQVGSDLLAKVRKSPLGNDWRLDVMNPVRFLKTDYDQKKARSANIAREDIANAFKRSYDGLNVGLYREKNKLYPIQWRSTEEERNNMLSHLDTIPIRGDNSVTSVPLAQVTDNSAFHWEEPYILRWDRQRQVAIQGSPLLTSTFVDLKKSVTKDIDAYPLPVGFSLFWDGEEDSSKTAQAQLVPGVVPTIIVILLCLMATFNNFRSIAVILCTLPFAVIGVTFGLLLFNVPFGFMALLGTMSLAGMMNKNIVVLLDACNESIANGMHPYQAIVEAAVRRARPVILAAGTTVLGVIPLLQDIFWIGLGVAIMGGLTVGTILTLVAVPLFYAIIYGLQPPPAEAAK